MNKIERVLNALKGKEVDRPPFSFWYHFGLQHLPGNAHAQAEIEFFRSYDLDFVKVMNDYPYPLPGGLEVVDAEDDWNRLEPISGANTAWDEQLSAISIMADRIGKEALFIDTIFSPWTTARRLARSNGLLTARTAYPETVLAAMGNIAESLANYARAAVDRGAAGVFLSLGAATDSVMAAEEYAVWGRPFDLKILDAVRDAPFNVLHIHGTRIHFDTLLDYPVSAINWSHYTTAPSLKEGYEKSGKTVMGGINETTASHVSAPEIAEQVVNAMREIGPHKLIVTPGCSIPTDTPVRNMRAVKTAVEGGPRR
jgi:uroporphyrinogen decarboxylase